MERLVMTRAQQQHMLDVLADLFGREYGVNAKFTLVENTDVKEDGCQSMAAIRDHHMGNDEAQHRISHQQNAKEMLE